MFNAVGGFPSLCTTLIRSLLELRTVFLTTLFCFLIGGCVTKKLNVQPNSSVQELIGAYQNGEVCGADTRFAKLKSGGPVTAPLYVHSSGPFTDEIFRTWIGEDFTTNDPDAAQTLVIVTDQSFWIGDSDLYAIPSPIGGEPKPVSTDIESGRLWFCIIHLRTSRYFHEALHLPPSKQAFSRVHSETFRATMQSPTQPVRNLFHDKIRIE